MSGRVLICVQAFATEVDGAPRIVNEGDTFREGRFPFATLDSVCFKEFAPDHDTVETASAAPGEKRRTKG